MYKMKINRIIINYIPLGSVYVDLLISSKDYYKYVKNWEDMTFITSNITFQLDHPNENT
jgi:hypothetical protein